MQFTLKLFSTLDELEGLRPGWQALMAQVPENTGFFATWEYTQAYLRFHRPPRWVVVALYTEDAQVPVAVVPLSLFQVQTDAALYQAAKPLGVAYLPYIEFPIQSRVRRAALTSLLRDVLRERLRLDLVFLGPLHESSLVHLALLEDLGRTEHYLLISNPLSQLQIDTRGLDFEDYAREHKSSTVRNARYCERRLGKEGRVEVRIGDNSADLEAVFAAMCQHNEAQFGGAHIHQARPEWQPFLQCLITQLAPQGMLEVATLRLDGRAIALHLCFVYKSRRYFYLMTHDPAYRRFSPAKILMSHLIARSFAEQGVFCFGAGGYGYKSDWCKTVGDTKFAVLFLNLEAKPALQPHLTLQGLERFLRSD